MTEIFIEYQENVDKIKSLEDEQDTLAKRLHALKEQMKGTVNITLVKE